MTTRQEHTLLNKIYEEVKKTDLPFDYIGVHADHVEIQRVSAITFDNLCKLSELFGTRKINIDCDLGCASDRSHDTSIIITEITKQQETLELMARRKK